MINTIETEAARFLQSVGSEKKYLKEKDKKGTIQVKPITSIAYIMGLWVRNERIVVPRQYLWDYNLIEPLVDIFKNREMQASLRINPGMEKFNLWWDSDLFHANNVMFVKEIRHRMILEDD